MSLRLSSSLLFALLLGLGAVACDGDPPETDGGAGDVDGSMGGADAGAPLTCTELTSLTGVIDDSVSVMFDTAMTEERPRDLGLACGNTEAELRWAPQEVVEFTVPGDASRMYAVEFTSNVPGTQMDFNTVIQVRDTCEVAPQQAFPPRCFNDVAADEFRSTGAITAAGGSVLYFIVTGFSEPPAEQMTVDRGTVEVSFTVRGAEAPTITSGFLRLALDDVRIELTGTDENADVRGVAMNFYADGELLDIYGDGAATEDGDVFIRSFDAPAATGFDWTGGNWVRASEINLGPYLRNVGADEVQFRVFDAAWGVSDPLRVPIGEVTLVGLGETCDDENFCRPELACSTGVCIPSASMAALCDGAGELVITASPSMGTTVTQIGTTGMGMGLVSPPSECVPDANGGIGAETVYKVDVAVDNFDMMVTTDLPGSEDTDTILYVRGECPDSGTVLACNDDIDGAAMNFKSAVTLTDLTAGTYYVFVERYGGLMSGTIPHEVGVTITPIVASGMPCDAATTRCADGMACTAGMCP